MNDVVLDYALLDTLIAPIASQRVEFCIMLYLGRQHRLIGLRHVRGDSGGIDIPIRLFVADALALDARSAVMAHNHPSGDASASQADIALTSRLGRVLDNVGVRLIDHLVLAGPARMSLRRAGYL